MFHGDCLFIMKAVYKTTAHVSHIPIIMIIIKECIALYCDTNNSLFHSRKCSIIYVYELEYCGIVH